MSDAGLSARYTSVAIALHWLMALALGGMIALGHNMYDADHRPIEWMFQLHKSVGITLLMLVIVRLIWRVMNPPPALPDGMTDLERRGAHGAHMGLYVLMVVLPLTGWVMVSVSPFAIATVLYGMISWPHLPIFAELALETRQAIYPPLANIHNLLSWVLVGLFILHLAGAIKHELSDEEGVLKRMIPGLFGKTAPPRAPSRGALTAFGSAALFFGLIAGTPVIAQSLPGGAGETASQQASPAAGNWQVDYETSEIAFSGLYNGDAYSGTFEDWTADIVFDPEALDGSAVAVTVQTGSASTGSSLYDDTLEAGEWFDISTSPSASVALSSFAQSDDGYTATATVTIKGLSVDVPFAFTLDIEGGEASMTGQTVLSREALNLGQDSDPGGDWVADDVQVNVTVKASQISN